MKRRSTSLIPREVQVNTTMRYHLKLIRVAKINNTRNNRLGEDVEKEEPSCTVEEMQTGAAIMKNSMEVPQETKNRTLQSSNYTPGYLPKVYKNRFEEIHASQCL